MKNLKKKIAMLSALALAGSMLAGCGNSADDTNQNDSNSNSDASDSSTAVELTDDGDKLTILCWTGSDLEPMIKLFVESTDYTEDQITWVQVGTSGSEAKEQYQQYFAGDEDVDLYVAEADWILQYINNDEYSAPLSALGITEDQFSGAYPYTVAIGTDNNGVLKGASWQAAAGGYVYRTDLAEEYLGVTSPDEMQALISDWDGFEETAAKIKEASGGTTSMAATIGGMWQVYAANRDVAWVVDNKLTLDSASNFMDIAKSYRDEGYVTDVSQWSSAWYAIGQDDTTFGYFYSTWCLTNSESGQLYQAEGGESGATYGKYNICVGPTNYFWGGSWLVPSPKCNNKTIAADFVNFFTTQADTMQTYAETSGDFVNNVSAMQAIVDAGTNQNPLLGGQDQFAVLIDAASGIDMEGLITEYDSSVKSAFIDAVNGYVDGTYADKDAALEGFQDSVAAIYPSLEWDE